MTPGEFPYAAWMLRRQGFSILAHPVGATYEDEFVVYGDHARWFEEGEHQCYVRARLDGRGGIEVDRRLDSPMAER